MESTSNNEYDFPITTNIFVESDSNKERVSIELHASRNNVDEKTDFKNLLLSELPLFAARNNLLKRDINWIKSNGICLEKIRPGRSTIPGAGRGAFAQVIIKDKEVITPAPLLNIPNKASLLTYDTVFNVEGGFRMKLNEKPTGYQLLLNYCFGNKNSEMIFCPQTNAILINHCSDRKAEFQCNNSRGPNAKIQWAGALDPSTTKWLKKSVNDIKDLTARGLRGLSIEFIATRDIMPGEEVS